MKMCCYIFKTYEGSVAQMKRNALQRLINWKADEERKPMVLKGARQVGKTWLKK